MGVEIPWGRCAPRCSIRVAIYAHELVACGFQVLSVRYETRDEPLPAGGCLEDVGIHHFDAVTEFSDFATCFFPFVRDPFEPRVFAVEILPPLVITLPTQVTVFRISVVPFIAVHEGDEREQHTDRRKPPRFDISQSEGCVLDVGKRLLAGGGNTDRE